MPEMLRFPDVPLYRGWGEPMRTECTIDGLEVIQGKLPPGLEGTLYRNGADRQYPSGREDDIFIDGEGMFHMFRFEDGQVSYRSRWVHTQRWEAQHQAKRALFGRYRNKHTNDPAAEGVHQGTGNTTATWHAGHLFALKEDDHPYRMDPDTLETLGRHDFEGQLGAVSFTAHPKVDPITNELLGFSYQAKGDHSRDIAFYVFDADRKLVTETWFEMPYAACVHDFAITDEWAIFPFFPLITPDMDVLKTGTAFYQWNPDEEVHVALVPRRGGADGIRWFKGPAASAGHMMNAFRDGDRVHLDLCLYDGNCFPFFAAEGQTTAMVPPFLTRLTFDLTRNDGSYKTTRLMGPSCEMPRTDDRYQGRAYRHGYMIVYRSKDGSSAVGHIDHATGALETWAPGPGDSVQEPQFVPRTPGSEEGDGWLLVPVSRVSQNRSDLAVLDARDVAAGPVATIKLPVKVRSTFHGTWVPAEAQRTGRYGYGLADVTAL